MLKNILKIILIFILAKIIWPIAKRLAWASWCLTVLIGIYSFGWLSRGFAFGREKMIEYAQSINLVKGDRNIIDGDFETKQIQSNDLSELSDYLKNSKTVTVKAIRDLGFSANKSAILRKNLEKFGVIRTNPQLDNRGEIIMNENGIEDILRKIGEDLLIENPIMIN